MDSHAVTFLIQGFIVTPSPSVTLPGKTILWGERTGGHSDSTLGKQNRPVKTGQPAAPKEERKEIPDV